jgi:outer membrane protein OmpU
MNKITKIGASALCGSLAAISAANAGELTVTGGVDMSWTSLPKANSGNPSGIGSNLTFSGSGELDNGWSVALTVANTNANAYSNTNVVVGIPGLGDIRIDQGTTGTGIDRMDDNTPNVWEEAYATGLSTGIDTVSGVSAGTNIEWTPNTPDGTTVRVAWSPDVGGKNAADKVTGTSNSVKSGGFDITVEASGDAMGLDGLTLYGGVSQVENYQNSTAISGDHEEMTVGAKFAVGSFTLGYQWSEEDTGRATTNIKYQNDGYGVTFAINDDLSVGYNLYKSHKDSTTDVEVEARSMQVAYSVGGLSVRLADAKVDNALYATAATNQRDATTLSVALAF